MEQAERVRRQPAFRLACRIARRKARRKGDRDQVRACTVALRTPDIQDEVLERLMETRGDQIAITAIGDGTFLDWLIENWETIIEMIMTIINLFGDE